jgi:hypothetical protein
MARVWIAVVLVINGESVDCNGLVINGENVDSCGLAINGENVDSWCFGYKWRECE